MAIEFFGAQNGGIYVVVNGNGGAAGFAKEPEKLASFMCNHEYQDAYFLSCMDFASEYGFAKDGDAKEMFFKAEAIANKFKKEEAA